MSAHWMLYSYDALGLGHARRMLAIAGAVLPGRPDLSALLVTCSPQIHALPIPPGLDYIKLPSARKLTACQYVARSLRLDPDRLTMLRAALISETARIFEPDLLLVDKSPCGMSGELRQTLEAIHSTPTRRTKLVLGWRDILDAPAAVAREWAAKDTLRTIESWYDEVWVYGDPAIFDVREEYRMSPSFAARVKYIGYLAPEVDVAERARARQALGPSPVALVCAGGGEDGEALMCTWMEAVRQGRLPSEMRSLVVTGPLMPLESQRRLQAIAPESVTVVPFVEGLEAMVATADLVVGMAGYNTVCEVLGAGVPTVLIPRASQRDEQRLRATRLESRGLANCVLPEALTPTTLAAASIDALERGPRAVRRAADRLALDGLATVAGEVERLLPRPEPAASLAPGRFRRAVV